MGNLKAKPKILAQKEFGCYCYLNSKSIERCFYLTIKNDTLYFAKDKDDSTNKNEPQKVIKIDNNISLRTQAEKKFALGFSRMKSTGNKVYIIRTHNIENYCSILSLIKRAKRPRWDSELSMFCKECAKEFTVLRRQHHCRNCGRVFCNRHSSKRVLLPEYSYESKVRVCDSCFNHTRGLVMI